MSKVSIPPVTVVHYVDPLCPWSLGLEKPLKKLKDSYRDRLRVEYRTAVAVPEIKQWLNEYGFDYDSVEKFHGHVARQTGTDFEHDFLRRTGLKSSLPACLALKAAQSQNEQAAAEYLHSMMNSFLIKAQPFSEDALLGLARKVGLDARKLAMDMHSDEVGEAVRNDSKAMGRDQASFMDLIIVTSDGRKEKIAQAFDAASLEKAIDRIVPGLPKYPRLAK